MVARIILIQTRSGRAGYCVIIDRYRRCICLTLERALWAQSILAARDAHELYRC